MITAAINSLWGIKYGKADEIFSTPEAIETATVKT